MRELAIDFLTAPLGVRARELFDWSVIFEPASGVRLRVMHPLHCLMSRVTNVAALPGYNSQHSLNQMKASVVCLRAFLLESLDHVPARTILKLIERTFRFSLRDRNALKVFRDYGVDPFEAITPDPRLPTKFRNVRYPQMQSMLASRSLFKLAGADPK